MREVSMLIEYTCCFFGHRTINETEKLKVKLYKTIENLVVNENVDTFLFGSKSRFDSLCLELVTKLKEKYPHIKRIYVRQNFRLSVTTIKPTFWRVAKIPTTPKKS